MRVIALTGGIATGKSTVAGLLVEHGALLVDADRVAREVVLPGEAALAEITARFGGSVLSGDGALDRAALAGVIFADAQARRDLEAITHPRILARIAAQISTGLDGDAPLVVVDIPLFYESHHEAEFDHVLLVYADQVTQLRRLQSRDGLDTAAAQQRLDAQLPIDSKRGLATWVIDNSGERAATRGQVDRWWKAEVEALGGH